MKTSAAIAASRDRPGRELGYGGFPSWPGAYIQAPEGRLVDQRNALRELHLRDIAEPAIELDGTRGHRGRNNSLELGQPFHAQVVHLFVARQQHVQVSKGSFIGQV